MRVGEQAEINDSWSSVGCFGLKFFSLFMEIDLVGAKDKWISVACELNNLHAKYPGVKSQLASMLCTVITR